VRLRAERGVEVVAAVELPAGQNNRLLRLETADGGRLLAKLYQPDERDRLGREFGILAFLGERGFGWTPRALLRDRGRGWAVYSFEEGATRPAAAYTVEDGRELGRFAAALHAIEPKDCPVELALAINPTPSLGALVERIGARLRTLLDDEAMLRHELVRELTGRVDLAGTVGELTARAAAGLSADALAARLPADRWRLTSCDAGPHNVLVRPDGGLTVVDWEYGGWDDPMALPIGFVTHVTSLAVPAAAIAAFEQTYLELTDPSDTDLERMRRMWALVEVEWLTIHLNGLASEKVASRRFASASFDLDRYVASQIRGFEGRLVRVRELLGSGLW
jgi:Ser/Thr protein kinase RdoA (MazF antagonist)